MGFPDAPSLRCRFFLCMMAAVAWFAGPSHAERPPAGPVADGGHADEESSEEEESGSKPFRLLRVEEAYTQEQGEWQFRLTSSYAKASLQENEAEGFGEIEHTRQTVKRFITTLEIEYGVTDRIELDVAFPVTWWHHHKGSREEHEFGVRESFVPFGYDEEDLGDVGLALVYGIVEETDRVPAVSLEFGAAVPTGDEGEGFGTGRGGAGFGIAATKSFGRTFLTANLEADYAWDRGKEFEYGVGVLHFLNETADWSVSLELDGSTEDEYSEHAIERALHLTPGVSYGWVVGDSYRWQVGVGIPLGLTGLARHSDDFGVIVQVQVEF